MGQIGYIENMETLKNWIIWGDLAVTPPACPSEFHFFVLIHLNSPQPVCLHVLLVKHCGLSHRLGKGIQAQIAKCGAWLTGSPKRMASGSGPSRVSWSQWPTNSLLPNAWRSHVECAALMNRKTRSAQHELWHRGDDMWACAGDR